MANPPGSPSRYRRRSSSIFRIAQDPNPAHHKPPNGAAQSQPMTTGEGRSSWDFDLDPDEPPEEIIRNPSHHTHPYDDTPSDEETGLTDPERHRLHQQRSRLDERIVPSSSSAPHPRPGHRPAAAALPLLPSSLSLRDLAINGALIALWYSFSISISVYNKWMFSAENLDFHFPLFTTSAHMVVQFLCASFSLWVFPQFRPKRPEHGSRDGGGEYTALNSGEVEGDGEGEGEGGMGGGLRGDLGSGTGQGMGRDRRKSKEPLMSRYFYLTRVGPCGAATALDIGLGNFSLRFITLTFFTMCKSSVLAFVLLFAFAFRLERPTLRLCGVIGVMTVGVIMMVAGEAAFDLLGFVLVMTASLCSGFRWSLTQILLLRHPATRTPFSSIFFLTPVMFAVLFVLAMAIEGPVALAEGWRQLAAERGAVYSTGIMLFPGLLAFLMVSAEFALIKRTSVVTLSVCGIFKEVLTISAASVAFGDPLSPINVSGLVVTIVSIAGYNWLKISNARAQARDGVQQMLEMEDLSPRPGGEKMDERERDSAEGLMRPDHFALDMDDDEHFESKQVDGVIANGRANGFRKSPQHVE